MAAVVTALLFASASPVLARDGMRERNRLDEWNFRLVKSDAASAGEDVAATIPVRIPHDWSIDTAIRPDAPAAGHGGFFAGGMGVYECLLPPASSWAGRRVTLAFEGVYHNSRVFLNGTELASHYYGYTPFRVDLTSVLRPKGENRLRVVVDNSAQPNSRWYTGSGLLRPVWLEITEPLHLEKDELTVVTRELRADHATTEVGGKLTNATGALVSARVEVELHGPEGRGVTRASIAVSANANGEAAFSVPLNVTNPRAWSVDDPALYRLVMRVVVADQTVDGWDSMVGLRTLRWSAEAGLEINGRVVKLRGGNVHHDNGPLGGAAFDRAEERKAELLKAAGFNAVRTAHNPPSEAFLSACDRLGLLVMDELFDGWLLAKTAHDYGHHFEEEWRGDVDAWVRRDRNHPSVIGWSVGNEMFERGDDSGRKIAGDLVARIRRLDTTRPITAGVNGMGTRGEWADLDPLFAHFDLAGYNYELNRHEADHERLPQRVIFSAESYPNDVFANWIAMRDHPYVVGDFVWSAMDYLGEAGIGRIFPPDEEMKKHWEANMFPWHAAACGDIDLLGRRKPISHYRNIVWDQGERIYAAVVVPTPDGGEWHPSPWSTLPSVATWSWPVAEGTPMTVEVYSRYERVRLKCNGVLLGEQPTTEREAFRTKFQIPYQPGRLEIVGLDDGVEGETVTLQSAGPPARLRLVADRSELNADGQDLAYITVEAVDADGNWQPHALPLVNFVVQGQGALAAFCSGDPTSMEPFGSGRQTLFNGRALGIVRTARHAGTITVTVRSADYPIATLTLISR